MSAMKDFLEHIAYNVRVSSVRSTTAAGSGHPTSALSAADIVAALFFYAMKFDPQDPQNPDNDRFILSKGHASPVLYAIWKELGIVSEQELLQMRTFNSVLEGHPTPRFSRVEVATGSLGQGLSYGNGMALSARFDKRNFKTYVLLGDGECAEGQVWEATEIAAYYKLENLIGILDCNRLGQSAETMDNYHIDRYVNKFTAFGWKTFTIDGHNMQEIMDTFDAAQKIRSQPTMIIAKTIKGYGIESAENKLGFHGRAFTPEELPQILASLEKRFSSAVKKPSFTWKPHIPQTTKPISPNKTVMLDKPGYKHGDLIPTRKAYGQALTALGKVAPDVISLDAEVKNSTFAELFEQAFPDRFVQCFIAEQNMVSMAVGLAARGKIPFVSTFGVFFTRAFDQIRMAAIGRSPLRLVGSHAGVSIGQDGPSQMALEDIAMMRVIPNSVVLYPCDAMSTYKMVELIANRADGISYIRTTRSATPVIYNVTEQFSIGGCKVLEKSDKDVACIIAAGITLFQALQAAQLLKKEGISVSVIDLYSIKPLDYSTIVQTAGNSGQKIVTVEDHYLEGGLGQAVTYALRNDDILITCLAVQKLPRSGKPEELLAYEEIDANAIVNTVKKLMQK